MMEQNLRAHLFAMDFLKVREMLRNEKCIISDRIKGREAQKCERSLKYEGHRCWGGEGGSHNTMARQAGLYYELEVFAVPVGM